MDTLRRTKIVATLGPATDSPEILAGMVAAGLDVARINFSHGTREAQRKRVEMVRHAASQAGRFVGLLADLAGPKIRIESFRDGPVLLARHGPGSPGG
jgi:pyruvate kinase